MFFLVTKLYKSIFQQAGSFNETKRCVFSRLSRATRPFLRRQRPGYLISAFSKTGSAQRDVGSAELDQTDEQQHQGHAGHAKKVRPVQAKAPPVAILTEARD